MIFQDDQERMGEILKATESVALQFLESLSTRPAGYALQPLPHDVLPDEGVGAMEALSQFRNKYEAQLSGSPGPRYLGFVTGGSTPAALAGDWLTSAYDQNASDRPSDAADHIEHSAIGM